MYLRSDPQSHHASDGKNQRYCGLGITLRIQTDNWRLLIFSKFAIRNSKLSSFLPFVAFCKKFVFLPFRNGFHALFVPFVSFCKMGFSTNLKIN